MVKPKACKYEHFKITIRFTDRLVTNPLKFFKRHCHTFVISHEGKETGGHHWECYGHKVTSSTPDNFKKMLVNFYKGECKEKFEPAELIHGFHVGAHADPDYRIGYCWKEGTPVHYHPAQKFTPEFIDHCQKRYASGEAEFFAGKTPDKLSYNQVCDLFYDTYMKLTEHAEFDKNFYKYISHYVPDFMIQVSPFISVQTFQKIKIDSLTEHLSNRVEATKKEFLLLTDDKKINNILKKNISSKEEKNVVPNSVPKKVNFEEASPISEDSYLAEEVPQYIYEEENSFDCPSDSSETWSLPEENSENEDVDW